MKHGMHDQMSASSTPAAKRKRRNDVILVLGLLLVIFAAGLALFLFRSVGDTVTVTVNGEKYAEYSLSEDREVEIRVGEGYNILVIEEGRAYVRVASCPDGICSSHRPIGHDGESIICLPNKVVIEIHTQDRQQPDIIT